MKTVQHGILFGVMIGATLGLAFFGSNPRLNASTWTGFDGNWSSDGNPGWNGTGVPNGHGAVADNPIFIPATTTQDIAGGVTVGTLSLSGSGDARWLIDLDPGFGLILDEDGAGPGHATISNSNTSPFGQLYVAGGTITLADDLLIEHTGGSNNTGLNNGAFRITSPIDGAGNVTFRNNAPTYPSDLTNSNYPGATLIFNGANFSSFIGAVTVEKGLVLYQSPSSFGADSNVITVGSPGGGDAALMMTAIAPSGPQDINYDFVIAAGSGGVLTIGTLSGSTVSLPTFTGDLLLNDNLRIAAGNGSSTIGSTYSGVISGSGGVELDVVTTGGTSNGYVRFQGLNTYAGDTIVNAAVLVADSGDAIPNGSGKGNVDLGSSGTLRINIDETINGLTGGAGSTVNNRSDLPVTLTIGDNDVISTYSGLIENGDGIFNIAKIGSGMLTLTGNNTYTGTTTVTAGALQLNGSHTGGDAYQIGVDGTLTGSGATSASVILEGNISPGVDTGSLTVGELTVQDGATLTFDLDPANPTGSNDDVLSATGNVHLIASTLNLELASAEFGGGAFSTPGTWLLIDGATLTGVPPTTINFSFVEGLSGLTASLQYDNLNGDVSLVLASGGLTGDYNGDGTVDAADYVSWRKNGINGAQGYADWRSNFGQNSGSGNLSFLSPAVPEPSCFVLIVLAASALFGIPRRMSLAYCSANRRLLK